MDITVKNRPDVVAAVKKAGYAGPFTLDGIKAWATDSGVELPDNLDEIWAKTVKMAVGTDEAEDTDEGGDETPQSDADRIKALEEANAKKELEIESLKAKAKKVTPAGFGAATHGAHELDTKAINHRHLAEAKAYNKRAANGFGSIKEGKARFPDADLAEGFKAYFRLAVAGGKGYANEMRDREVLASMKTMVTYDNTLGGALIPEDFSAVLISLKEERGALRKLVPFIPMSRDTLTMPRRTAGITIYAPGEASAITASNPTFDNVTLTANKLAGLCYVSAEQFNDSALSVSDILAEEFAYAFADKEDECGINGDGTATYFTYVGILHKFRQVLEDAGGTWGTNNDNSAGLVVGAGNAYSELTLANFREVKARLPLYAEGPNCKWIMNKSFYWQVFVNEASELGGVTIAEAISGMIKEPFGYGIQFAQVMPKTEANSQICAVLGDFSKAMKIGEVRNGMTIASSEHYAFNQDVITIRGTERLAITVHDVGNYHATAASRVPGPIVGLVTANS